jgi:hypothetical protein
MFYGALLVRCLSLCLPGPDSSISRDSPCATAPCATFYPSQPQHSLSVISFQILRRTSRQRLNLGRCKQHAHWSASPPGGIVRPSRTPLMKTARNASAHTSEVRKGGDPLAEGGDPLAAAFAPRHPLTAVVAACRPPCQQSTAVALAPFAQLWPRACRTARLLTSSEAKLARILTSS